MTNIYFIRHAEPDYTNHNDMERPLTEKGLEDRGLVTLFLSDKNIDIVLSSPFTRAVETLKDFADLYGHPIITVDDFRERKVDSVWIEDFSKFTELQWNDFDYKLSDGESLREVQNRNIEALMQVLRLHRDKNIVIGSHGTALSTIINYFDPNYGFHNFQSIRFLMPWIVNFSFEGDKLINIEKIDVFNRRKIRKAVGAILITPNKNFLLVHKTKICDGKEEKTDVDYWDFIKCGLQENETMCEAIRREILEETGIDNFVNIEELSHKIYFEFPTNLKKIVEYDIQETTMFIVRLSEQLSKLRCEDDEINEYAFVDKDEVYDKLSHVETKEFWRTISKEL